MENGCMVEQNIFKDLNIHAFDLLYSSLKKELVPLGCPYLGINFEFEISANSSLYSKRF
jgi:hypothetical protein